MLNYLKAGAALHSEKYRSDIDGLRAIAVGSVVLSHAFPKLLPGGFVGVDIFFVISGYLISLILIRDIDRNAFSIWHFYNRRVRRIFPALVLVLIVIMAFGWFSLFRPEFDVLGRHIAASTLFSENFLLWNESGYFDVDSTLKPTLHLWSLAIEEQFYIFWPMLMFLAHRWRLNFALMFVIVAAISFVTNLHDVYSDPTAAYYSPLGRSWELMIGAGLAYIQAHRPALLARYSNLQSLAGLLAIVVALIFIRPESNFPGFWALLPTVGAFLLISGGQSAWINRRPLSTAPMVWCGLISYPLYLWHWPFLSYAHLVLGPRLPTKVAIACVAGAVVAATLTFLFVERPFRGRVEGKRKTSFLLGAMTAAMFCGVLVASQSVFPRLYRVDAPDRTEWSYLRDRFGGLASNPVGIFPLAPERPEAVLFIGDSHIAQYAEHLNRVIAEDKSRPGAVLAIGGGCVPIEGVSTNDPRRSECWAMRQKAYQMAEDDRFGTIVIGAAWNWYFLIGDYAYVADGKPLPVKATEGRQAALRQLAQQIDTWVHKGKRVYFLLDNPRSDGLDPTNGTVRIQLSAAGFKPNESASVPADQLALRQELLDWAKGTGAIVIDPLAAFCTGTTCIKTSPTGQPVYKDTNHFNPDWAIDHVTFVDGPIVDGVD